MLNKYAQKVSRFGLLALVLGASAAQAQTAPTPINISSATAIYTQNFDVMTPTGTTYPAGWDGVRLTGTGTVGAQLLPEVFTSGSNSGLVYNAGIESFDPAATAAQQADRTLGSLASGSTAPAWGAVFRNQTGAAVTRVNIACRMEQWRTGNNATVETTFFEYSLDATSLTTGTWTGVSALDLVELDDAAVQVVPTNGNSAAYRRNLSGTINLTWPTGTTMWIRWRDIDNIGNDALMGVDDFAMSTGTVALATRNTADASALNVYPNPAADVLNIRLNNVAVNAAISVSDLTGRVVLKGNAANGVFDVRSLSAGSYIVTVDNGKEKTTQKLVKL